MKRLIALLLTLAFTLTSCGPKYERFEAQFPELFDVYATIIGYAENQESFDNYAGIIREKITKLNALYDIYNDYEGVNNLKTVNDNAGISPVKVDGEIIDMLLFSKKAFDETEGGVNVALGPVLKIWHDYREQGLAEPENATLPPMDELTEANKKADISGLIINEKESTVFLKEKGMALDVGAIAKGYAAQKALDAAVEAGMTSVLINMGGNVVTKGKPLDGKRRRWSVGIQDAKIAEGNIGMIMDTIYTNDAAVVTSGNYQRFYMVNGKNYNHIIDPATLMPAERYAAVTVLCGDSAIADMLSTSLFILPVEDGLRLLGKYGADAMWVHHDGVMEATEGYIAISKTLGGAEN